MTKRNSEQDPVAGGVVREDGYTAIVPDTLDLTERARLAINALTGSADERFFYERCQCSHLDHQTPYMNWVWNGPCMPKPLHALPLLLRGRQPDRSETMHTRTQIRKTT